MTADRVNRRHIVISTQVAAMLLASVLAALTLSHKVQVWHVFVLASLLGVVNAFDIPGRQSFLVDMVGKEDLMNAIALNSSMFNGARVVGPAVAGILVARIGEGWCFFANAVSYIAVIIGLLLMKVHSPARALMASPLEHIMEGFRFVNRTAPIRALLMLLGLVSLVGMPYVVLMPIFADKILHGGARGLGILMGATGVGALLGALTLAFREGVKGLGRWVAMCCAGFGASLVVFSISHSFWISVILLLPVGYTMMLQMACSNTLIQVMVPTRCGAGDGRLFHDVHGHGSDWSFVWRRSRRPPGRSGHRGHRRFSVSGGCGLVLVSIAEDSRGSAALDRSSGRSRRRAGGDERASSGRLDFDPR